MLSPLWLHSLVSMDIVIQHRFGWTSDFLPGPRYLHGIFGSRPPEFFEKAGQLEKMTPTLFGRLDFQAMHICILYAYTLLYPIPRVPPFSLWQIYFRLILPCHHLWNAHFQGICMWVAHAAELILCVDQWIWINMRITTNMGSKNQI